MRVSDDKKSLRVGFKDLFQGKSLVLTIDEELPIEFEVSQTKKDLLVKLKAK